MLKRSESLGKALLAMAALAMLAGCSTPTKTTAAKPPAAVAPTPVSTPPSSTKPPESGTSAGTGASTETGGSTSTGAPAGKDASVVVKNPTDIHVLVNKIYMLPDGYIPPDLVEPNVPFIFKEKDEKREMRKEAAQALEQMFAAAKKDGVALAGVSGYRSYTTQTGLFNYYVKTQGEETARRYSAVPGHSEHQTGLAMDVSGIDGKCAADDCFAGTPEANWLASHAPEYGFIIRYPQGKEGITGYAYEPWHVRYVGAAMAKDITAKGITLDQYPGAVK